MYRHNSPTNVYGNSHVVMEVNYDSTYLNSNFIKVPILDNRLGFLPGKKFISATNTGLLFQNSFDSLTFSTGQILNLDSMLLDRPTLADGALLYRPLSYTPTYTDVVTGLGYSPLNPIDTLNLSNRINSKLSIEVDGSVTNEIELPSQTGQSGKYLSTDGTTTSWSAATFTLPNTGTPGTYGGVTTDLQGRVTSGKRMEVYSGVTNGSGAYTVVFSTAYTVTPNIQANIIGATDTQNLRITSITTTGFTILVRNRVDVVGLLPTWNNVTGATVDVLISEK